MQLVMDGCAVRAYITGLKADVLRAPDKAQKYFQMHGLNRPALAFS
jgi:hypothetical protein